MGMGGLTWTFYDSFNLEHTSGMFRPCLKQIAVGSWPANDAQTSDQQARYRVYAQLLPGLLYGKDTLSFEDLDVILQYYRNTDGLPEVHA
eukprot:966948-Amphidinium_carterae.1